MLSFIPMNERASIYSQGAIDAWGQPSSTITYSSIKCNINYNTDLVKVSGDDGVQTTVSATVIFNGFISVNTGDFVEFTTAMHTSKKYRIIDVFFITDYAGKIVSTRVVVGSGKRV